MSLVAPASSGERNFDIGVSSAPQQRQARQPVLAINELPCAGVFFSWQNACYCGGFRARNFASNGARRHPNLRIVSDSLVLAGNRPRHYVKLAILFTEPDCGRNRGAVLAERGERNVFLAANGCRNRGSCHAHIVAVRLRYCSPATLRCSAFKTSAAILKVGLRHKNVVVTLRQVRCHSWTSPEPIFRRML